MACSAFSVLGLLPSLDYTRHDIRSAFQIASERISQNGPFEYTDRKGIAKSIRLEDIKTAADFLEEIVEAGVQLHIHENSRFKSYWNPTDENWSEPTPNWETEWDDLRQYLAGWKRDGEVLLRQLEQNAAFSWITSQHQREAQAAQRRHQGELSALNKEIAEYFAVNERLQEGQNLVEGKLETATAHSTRQQALLHKHQEQVARLKAELGEKTDVLDIYEQQIVQLEEQLREAANIRERVVYLEAEVQVLLGQVSHVTELEGQMEECQEARNKSRLQVLQLEAELYDSQQHLIEQSENSRLKFDGGREYCDEDLVLGMKQANDDLVCWQQAHGMVQDQRNFRKRKLEEELDSIQQLEDHERSILSSTDPNRDSTSPSQQLAGGQPRSIFEFTWGLAPEI